MKVLLYILVMKETIIRRMDISHDSLRVTIQPIRIHEIAVLEAVNNLSGRDRVESISSFPCISVTKQATNLIQEMGYVL